MAGEDDIAEIIETFDLLGDWDQRYQYLVELGDRLPPLDPVHKVDDNLVKECMSTVHVVALPDQDHPDRLIFQGDCDTSIIKESSRFCSGCSPVRPGPRSMRWMWTSSSKVCTWRST